MNLALGAQALQPGREELVHFLLGEDLPNFPGHGRQRNLLGPGLFELGKKLIAIVRLDAVVVDLDCRSKPGFHLTQSGDVVSQPRFERILVKTVGCERGAPRIRGGALVLGLEFRDALLHLIGRRQWRLPLRLFAKKFLVNEPIEGASPILVRDLAQRLPFHESLEMYRVVPIALQNDITIYGGDNAVDDIAAISRTYGEQQR